MSIESIPSGYEAGYPDGARHYIEVDVIYRSYPYQVVITPMKVKNIMEEFASSSKDVKGHLSLWRSFALARK